MLGQHRVVEILRKQTQAAGVPLGCQGLIQGKTTRPSGLETPNTRQSRNSGEIENGSERLTFTVYAMAPRPARYRNLVLLAAGVTALSTEPWGTGAAARVWITMTSGTLAACRKRGRQI